MMTGPVLYPRETAYTGDGVQVTPPKGSPGLVAVTVVDGNTIKRSEFASGTPGVGASRDTTYAYDASGRMTSRVTASGGFDLTSDPEGHLAPMTKRGGGSQTFAYHGTGSRHVTVTGAYDVRTGEVAAGHSGSGFCAETHCVTQLVGCGSDPANIRFVEAIWPRTGAEVPICTRCQGMCDPSQFSSGVQHQSPGPWEGQPR